MHIPDGFLNAATVATTYACCVGGRQETGG